MSKKTLLIPLGVAVAGCTPANTDLPNIVFILADDLGWGDVGCYGQKLFETPNIDSLAAHGMRFTQCYSGTTVSAPSRSCLVTGTHSGHTAIRGNLELDPEGQFPLPSGIATVFKDLQDAGYRTGAFGKWGLGFIGSSGDPQEQGIDRFYGFNCQLLAHSYYPDHLWDNSTRVDLPDNQDGRPYGQGSYAPDLIHRKALEFLDQAAADGQRFFMWYPTTIPHAELISPEDSLMLKYRGMYPETPYNGTTEGMPGFQKGGYYSQSHPHAAFAAMVSRLDTYVGQIIDRLRENGQLDNTVIIFASDNGPHKEGGADPDFFNSNGPWRGYKRDVYEGGIRVPMIVSWPGHIPQGRESEFVCTFWDLMPSIRELTGHRHSADVEDGVSLLPLLRGRGKQKEHKYLYFEFQELGGRQAVRKGPWKLVHLNVRGDAPVIELYNLQDDPGETTDLSAQHPDIVEELAAIMRESHVPNPNFPLLPGE